jgi:hypothetical protein
MATAKTTTATEEKTEAPSFVIKANDAFALQALDAWMRSARNQNVDAAAVQKVADIREAIAKYQEANGAEVAA